MSESELHAGEQSAEQSADAVLGSRAARHAGRRHGPPTPRPPTSADLAEPTLEAADAEAADDARGRSRGRGRGRPRRPRPQTPRRPTPPRRTSGRRGRTDDEDVDPVVEFKTELRLLPGDWYVVHSYAGYENRVRTNLESRTQSLNMEDYIFQIEVPTHEVVEIKGGKRQQVQEKVLPGYILVRMDLTDESWAAVRNTPGVTGFVGLSSKPSPLSLDEVANLLAPGAGGEGGQEGRDHAGRGGGLRGRPVRYRYGRAVRDAAGDGERDQPRYPEAQGAGLDLRPGDPGGASFDQVSKI